ncbi:bactofilin family protein [Enterobacter hormaechei]|uniref:bactofilin family protein n=1 Tax=Enterobacter hormaechei TaxID=158836 RepID=UPI0032DAF716
MMDSGIGKGTLIASGMIMTGSLGGEGDICIEGFVKGDVRGDGRVVIGTGGRVVGDIYARELIIGGEAEGRLHAGLIVLQPEGRVRGDIYTDELEIIRGGVFTGRSHKGAAEAPVRDGVVFIGRSILAEEGGEKNVPEEKIRKGRGD